MYMADHLGKSQGSTLMTVLAVVGGIFIIVIGGFAIGYVVLNVAGSSPDANGPGTNVAQSAEAQPTVTVIEPTVVVSVPPQPPATSTVTVNPPTVPGSWPSGYWSSGSPCLIPYPGLELGLEYGYTTDATIKSWVAGVQQLIQRLFDQGWTPTPPGPIDGEYGAKTEAGVLGFQQAYGIPVVGRVGPTTWATLRNQCERFR